MQSYNAAIVGWTFSILLISRQAREKKNVEQTTCFGG